MFKTTTFLLIASLFMLSFAHPTQEGHKCTHDTRDKPEPIIYDEMESEDIGRILTDSTTNVTYPQIRMKGYTDALADNGADIESYMANDIIPPILSYFTAALQIKTPFKTNLKFSSSQATVCSVTTPAELKTGIPYDFYYIVDASTDTSSTWVASTYACFLTSNTKRPYVAKTTLNLAQFGVADTTTQVLLHEKNMVCVMHELTHALGFSTSLYKYFLDANGTTLTGHILTGTLDDETTTIINVAPLTAKLRSYYGCPSLKGAYMENDGSSGTYGSHFERRHFGFEAMTSGLIYEMQYSQFTLAMLEGSGWYVPDYSYADPFFFGQGQGCYFLFDSCEYALPFSEFCIGTTRGCANPGRGGGSCASDLTSDSCRFVHPSSSYDCESSSAVSYARLPTAETYGRGLGSKCFTGTLTTASSASSTSFCFKFSCSGSGSNTVLTVNVGSQTAKCSAEGTATVTGYNGVINCPDPLTFCSTVGAPSCPRGCMGQGTCVNGACKCNSGFSGTDCALNA